MPVPHHSVFTDQMPFLPPNQQRQSTEGTSGWPQSRTKNSRIFQSHNFTFPEAVATKSMRNTDLHIPKVIPD